MNQINYRGYNGQVMAGGTLTYEHGPLMLGSGVPDTEGVEICEDDIVTWESWVHSPATVTYHDGCFWVGENSLHSLVENRLDLTIIGNIHEQE